MSSAVGKIGMRINTGKEAISRPIKMTKDDFGLNLKKVIENRDRMVLKLTFRKTAKAWVSKKVS